MPEETISVTTYVDPETITLPEAPDGARSAISIVPSWGDNQNPPETY
jgi:hypothetical protein